METIIKKKSKFQVDKETGWKLRADVIHALNDYFVSNSIPYKIDFLHKYNAPKPAGKESKKNTITNRITDFNPDSAMGFDCELENINTKKKIYILIRFTDDANCYIKDSSENSKQPQYFIDALIGKNAYFLYVQKDRGKALSSYSNLLPLAKYRNKWVMDTSPGNANRVVIPSVVPGSISCHVIDAVNLFGSDDNLLTQIKEILG
jgi:hypothetical protein